MKTPDRTPPGEDDLTKKQIDELVSSMHDATEHVRRMWTEMNKELAESSHPSATA
jgi:hypothetical protein